MAQYFEIKWWRSYIKGKDKADYLRKKDIYWRQMTGTCADVLQIKDTDSIIDLGCGPAGIYMIYNRNSITAVDPLIDKYEADIPVFSPADYPNVRFVKSTIEEYQDKQTYDVVFCMNAINHVSDIDVAFSRLSALAHTGSTIIVTIDAHTNSLMKAIFRIGPGDILHPHQYDKQEYTNFLEKNNCEVIKTVQLEKGLVFDHYLLLARKK